MSGIAKSRAHILLGIHMRTRGGGGIHITYVVKVIVILLTFENIAVDAHEKHLFIDS